MTTNIIQHSQKNPFSLSLLNKLRKGQLIRILFLEEKKLIFFRGRILSIHKAGNLSTIILQRKIRGISIDMIFPLFAPFIRQIEFIY